MLYLKRFLFLLAGLALSAGLSGQSIADPARKISPEALRLDYQLLKDSLLKIHPSLYRYKSKAEIDHLFDSGYASLRYSMTIPEFYALTCFTVASIEDGHANSRLSGGFMDDYWKQASAFPAMVMFIHNRAFILCCKQKEELAETELLSIDNHPMSEITSRLFTYISSDGSIESRKNWELPENFQLLYNIIYGVKTSYVIEYQTKLGEVKTTTLEASLFKDILCAHPFPRPGKYLQLEYRPGAIAILTVKTFFNGFLKMTGENFRQFLDSAFKDLADKKNRKLIIDIRGNQGGNDDNGIMLYSYLTGKPFAYYASQETVYEKFELEGHPNLAMQQYNENNFTGKVYFLTDGRSFSAAAEFASISRSNKRGIFIGEETGGGYAGDTSGDDVMLTLPNTQITVRIPTVKYSLAVKPAKWKDSGVKPDYPFYKTIVDIVNHTDGQMVYALKIAEEK